MQDSLRMVPSVFERFQLRPLAGADAEELHSLIEAERPRLARWLRWAADQTFEGTVGFIRKAETEEDSGNGCHRAIVIDGKIAGMVGFIGVDPENRSAALGYWLGSAYEGGGVVTEAVREMIDHALWTWKLNRVEIRPASANRRSCAVPERLGFRRDGVLRQAERVEGRYLDSVVYSMLASDWRPKAQKTGLSV